MSHSGGQPLQEAKRQAQICNACRYCEGFCSVFPALHQLRELDEKSLIRLANVCHNCRGCYYACQYAHPHEFDVNIPKVFAQIRHQSWTKYATLKLIEPLFQRRALLLICTVICFTVLMVGLHFWFGDVSREGFYAIIPHNVMVGVFAPLFLIPYVMLFISLRKYWRDIGGASVRLSDIFAVIADVANMKNLSGGHGDGCNYEDTDRFSRARTWAHHLLVYGFLLCFASTVSATALHYFFDMPAPYPAFSLPKLLGVPGGSMMVVGAIWMLALKLRADKQLSYSINWYGEVGFILLLLFIALSGLLLYFLRDHPSMPFLLYFHLGTVAAFFLLTPFSRMVHGFYRFLAMLAQKSAE